MTSLNTSGARPIPFNGCVIRTYASQTVIRNQLVPGATVGFDTGLGLDVKEAIACGPQLVRNGNIDIDLDLEGFGEKDTAVMSFFLPRTINRYEAARSFLGQRADNSLFMGVVSGRAFGTGAGPQDTSHGMTFGELALLAQDLGAVDAMALDGGGSSSIVVKQDGRPQTLNVSTGGTDVPRGAQRFIANAIFFG